MPQAEPHELSDRPLAHAASLTLHAALQIPPTRKPSQPPIAPTPHPIWANLHPSSSFRLHHSVFIIPSSSFHLPSPPIPHCIKMNVAAPPAPAFVAQPLLRFQSPSKLPSRSAHRRVNMVAARRTRCRTTVLQSPPPEPTQKVRVDINAPGPNKRIINASNLINAPMPIVWQLLSDYSRLSEHIPNLLVSALRPHPRKGIRVEQCGVQSILGFQFRASLVMDMTEVNRASEEWRAIDFQLVSSPDFREFQGTWRMQHVEGGKTALYYSVGIMPKGLVPVRAIEWRIAEDVPGNMDAVRLECERRRRLAVAANRKQTANGNNADL